MTLPFTTARILAQTYERLGSPGCSGGMSSSDLGGVSLTGSASGFCERVVRTTPSLTLMGWNPSPTYAGSCMHPASAAHASPAARNARHLINAPWTCRTAAGAFGFFPARRAGRGLYQGQLRTQVRFTFSRELRRALDPALAEAGS